MPKKTEECPKIIYKVYIKIALSVSKNFNN